VTLIQQGDVTLSTRVYTADDETVMTSLTTTHTHTHARCVAKLYNHALQAEPHALSVACHSLSDSDVNKTINNLQDQDHSRKLRAIMPNNSGIISFRRD